MTKHETMRGVNYIALTCFFMNTNNMYTIKLTASDGEELGLPETLGLSLGDDEGSADKEGESLG
jgi:hypothetical protein